MSTRKFPVTYLETRGVQRQRTRLKHPKSLTQRSGGDRELEDRNGGDNTNTSEETRRYCNGRRNQKKETH